MKIQKTYCKPSLQNLQLFIFLEIFFMNMDDGGVFVYEDKGQPDVEGQVCVSLN